MKSNANADKIWIDIATRVALGLWFAFSSGVYFKNAVAYLHALDASQSGFTQAANILAILSTGLFSFLIACLYAIRLQPVNKLAGPGPFVTAVLGAFVIWSLLLLKPRADLSPALKITAALLVLAGNVFALVALRHLGRSFSILPEGRKLVTSGPYHIIRHPLYVAEAVATIGALINFLSPAAVVIVAVQFLLQLGRIHYEEKVLRTTFPEYKEYSRHTARLIPGIY